MALPADDTGSDGPAIVLLHAGVADRRMWTELLPELAGAGYRAIAMDLPGFGDAELPPESAPFLDVLETMDALSVADAVLVGNSYGGAVALRVAALAPERVRGLVLVSTPPVALEPSAELERIWDDEASALDRGDVDAAVASIVEGWTLPGAPGELRDRVAAMQRRAYELQLGVEVVDGPDPLDAGTGALKSVAAPVLIACGEADLPDFREGADRLAELFERAEVVTIPEAGHLAPLEQPEAFRELALGYLEAQAPAERPPS